MSNEIDSSNVRRFVSKLACHLNDEAMKADQRGRRGLLREGHAATTRHDMGSVVFHLIWKGEQRFWVKAGTWTAASNMLSVDVEGNEDDFVRDMTMLMMVAEFD